jgi:hypothetical protein
VVRGTAPEMTPDLREIIDGVSSALPEVAWDQLVVSFPADDDGLWFFRRPGVSGQEVEIESSTGVCPFYIEADDAEPDWGRTPAETVEKIVALLAA